MAAGGGVFAGVAIGRAVAAEGDAAFLTGAQVHPIGADLDACFAFEALRMEHGRDRYEMGTWFVRHIVFTEIGVRRIPG
jgi:uncharacterized membrane protein YhhN